MKSILLFACALLTGTTVLCQKVVFRDDFSGNANNWPVQTSGPDQFQIIDGKYVLEGFSDSTRFATVPINLDSAKNYSVSVNATHLSGVTDYEYGLYLGSKDGKNSCAFAISSNGHYKFYGYLNGVYTQFFDWTPFTQLKTGSNAVNKITLNKVGGDWVLYLNDKWVAAVPVRFPFNDLQAGLSRSNKQKVAFDDFTVTEIN